MAGYARGNSYLGMIIEATRGTTPGAGTPFYIPVMAPQITPSQTLLRDEALRGSPVTPYDQVLGVRHDEVDFKCYGYDDTFPNLLVAALGSTDTVAGAGPYTHTIGLLNAITTGSQPPSYSIMDCDGANYFITPGAQLAALDIEFGAEKALESTLKYICNPYVDSTTVPVPFGTPSFSTISPIPAWDTTVSINSVAYTTVQEGMIKIDRKTKPIHANTTIAPYQNFAEELEVTGHLLLVVSTNADAFSISTTTGLALSRTPVPLVVTFTNPQNGHTIALTMSATQFHTSKRKVDKAYTEVEVQFTCNGNVTDALTGYSSIKTVTTNSVSTAYH